LPVFQIQQTELFAKWLVNLRDVRGKARILARLDSVRLGNLGDIRSVGGSVSEMRIDVSAGYRV
jgi:putative addiction module killer protein